MATIYDVAQRAGVSASTVSRVVNGQPNVAPELAQRVRTAMRDLDYQPNAAARNLRRSRSSLWAVIISDIGNAFFTTLVRGVEDVARRAGFSVVLCNSDEDPAKESRYVTAALAEQMAGVIISPSADSGSVERLRTAGTPVVVIDRRVDGGPVDTVLVDNAGGADEAVTHLLDSGYQRVACITGPAGLTTADQRLAGYLRAMERHGSVDGERLVRRADFRERGGYRAMAELLGQHPAPDAVFSANNLMTVGALECLAAHDLSVPEQVGVVGFDDVPWASLVRPSPTTVAQPTHELGRTAALLLIERIASPNRPVASLTLSTELRVRESSRRPGQ